MAIEIVDFPIKHGGSFHGKMLVHQMVIENPPMDPVGPHQEIYGLLSRSESFGASWLRRTLVLGRSRKTGAHRGKTVLSISGHLLWMEEILHQLIDGFFPL